jgi:hypothetical protein
MTLFTEIQLEEKRTLNEMIKLKRKTGNIEHVNIRSTEKQKQTQF